MTKGNEDLSNQFNSFRAGNEEGAEFLVRYFGASIYDFALKIVGHPATAKDLTQRGFTLAFDHREEFISVDHVTAFLYGFVIECGGRYLAGLPCEDEDTRRVLGASSTLETLDHPAVAASVARLKVLRYYINVLSPKRQEVMFRRYLLHMDIKAIAAELGLRPQTVYNHIADSKKYLRIKLNGEYDPRLLA